MHYLDFLLPVAHGILALSAWITNHKEYLAICLAAMGGVSGLLLEPIKKLMSLSDTKISDHIKVLRFVPFVKNFSTVDVIHYLFAACLTGVHYLQGSHSDNPIIILGQAFVVLGGNRFLYPAIVKPVSQVLSNAKAIADIQKAELKAKQLANTFQG